MHTPNMSKSMSVDCLLEQFLPNSLDLSNTFNALGAQVQNSIESPAAFIAEVKELTWGHLYRKHVSERDPNYIFKKSLHGLWHRPQIGEYEGAKWEWAGWRFLGVT